MPQISGGQYMGVRYAPHFNHDRPYQIVATNNDGEGSYFTELTINDVSDLYYALETFLKGDVKDG